MTPGEKEALTKMLAVVIQEEVTKAVRARMEPIERQQKEFHYRGVWQPAETYAKGNSITYDGSLWIAIDDAPSKPGVGGWQLAAKRGDSR